MTTFNLDLYFKTHKDDVALPPHPVAQIYVKNLVGHSYPDAEGMLFVTPQCINEGELEHELSRLEREIKEIRAKAKKKFAKG